MNNLETSTLLMLLLLLRFFLLLFLLFLLLFLLLFPFLLFPFLLYPFLLLFFFFFFLFVLLHFPLFLAPLSDLLVVLSSPTKTPKSKKLYGWSSWTRRRTPSTTRYATCTSPTPPGHCLPRSEMVSLSPPLCSI